MSSSCVPAAPCAPRLEPVYDPAEPSWEERRFLARLRELLAGSAGR